ncbi:translation initiation factor IF-2 N-terminal domain-containing protein, partial [Thermodesulfobacteriota bacterium]
MAKIRIYELARDLNMTNKTLLEKLRDLDIPAKTHMSSLDEKSAARVKENLFGTPEKEIEITRIKPTIIRKRRKKIKEAPARVETAPEPEEVEKDA